jgi:hypothetical protein
MNEEEQQHAPQTPQPAKARRGCLFYSCLGGFVLMLLVLLGGLVGLHYAKKMFSDFTDNKPATLPGPKLSPAEIQQVQKRVDDFREKVRGGTAPAPLALTADEINALISSDRDMRGLRNKLYVTGIEGDRVKGQLSIPMEEVGLQMFRSRYLNATGLFTVSLRNGTLRLTALDLIGKGKPLPKVYMDQIRSQNLAKPLNSDPRISVALDWIQSVEVKDGKLVITPKEKPPQ